VCIVNIAAQNSALNTWTCIIVRRVAAPVPGVDFDASDAGTVAPSGDSYAVMICALR
jgi:hypothetical protein